MLAQEIHCMDGECVAMCIEFPTAYLCQIRCFIVRQTTCWLAERLHRWDGGVPVVFARHQTSIALLSGECWLSVMCDLAALTTIHKSQSLPTYSSQFRYPTFQMRLMQTLQKRATFYLQHKSLLVDVVTANDVQGSCRSTARWQNWHVVSVMYSSPGHYQSEFSTTLADDRFHAHNWYSYILMLDQPDR